MAKASTDTKECQSGAKGEKAPSLVKELETAKILHELSQGNTAGKTLDERNCSRSLLVVSPTASCDGKETTNTKKRRMSELGILPHKFCAPHSSSSNRNQDSIDSSSQTFELPFSLRPDEDDDSSSSTSLTGTNENWGELSSTLSLGEGCLSLGKVSIKPLMPPPQMRCFNNFSNPIDPLKMDPGLPTIQGAHINTISPESFRQSAYTSETTKISNQFAIDSPLMPMGMVLNNDKRSIQHDVPMCQPLNTIQLEQPNNISFADQLLIPNVYPFANFHSAQQSMTPSPAPSITSDALQFISPKSKPTKKRKICRMDQCELLAAKRTPYCVRHAGQRKCEFMACTKFAQGKTRFCIAHGGGRRCLVPNCLRGARDQKYCAAHGGGRRCRFLKCTKLAVGGGFTCTAHGGGRRCDFSNCTKSAQSSSNFCVRHGGGRKCNFEGCDKVARGKTSNGMCMSHANLTTSSQNSNSTISAK